MDVKEKHPLVPLAGPPQGSWSTTQACALTRNQTTNLSVHRLALNLLSHTSQGAYFFLNHVFNVQV